MAEINKIQLRRGTAAAWTSANPVLSAGVPGLETDTLYMKFGDGVTAWISLSYATVSKAYIDALALGIVSSWKSPVRVATVSAMTFATDFTNGQTIDGISLVTGDRILIKNQASAIENGIYTVNASGAPTRSTDADTAAELEGVAVMVQQGTAGLNTTWIQTTDGITLGVSNIVWSQMGTTVPDASATTKGIAKLYTDVAAQNTDGAPDQNAVFDALALKADLTALDSYVNEETFATLTFASPTVWACDNRQSPLAKLTATGDFTIDMTNVKSGSQGVLKVTASTASAFTITFDTSFTNVEATTNDSLLTYTFPADNGQFYFLQYICDGTILHWIILDTIAEGALPFAQVGLSPAQSISNNDSTVFVSFTSETHDNASIWAIGTPTRLVIPGSGDKLATISIRSQWAANATGLRRNLPYLNGSTTGDIAQIFGNATAPIHHSTHQIACAGGDYIEILAYQNSGGSLSLDACSVRISIHDR